MTVYVVSLVINGGTPHIKLFSSFDRAYMYMEDDFYDQVEAYGFHFDEDGNTLVTDSGEGFAHLSDPKGTASSATIESSDGHVLRWQIDAAKLEA